MTYALRLLCVLSAVALAGVPAHARMFGEFEVGNWYGAAYTDQKGQFNHCAVMVDAPKGLRVGFAVGRNFTWSMDFTHKQWKYKQGDAVPVMFAVDDMEPFQIDGRALDPISVEIGLGESAELFNQFRMGRTLKVLGLRKPIEFRLTGVDRALSRLFACAYFKGRKSGPIVADDPAEDIHNYTARQMRSDSAMVAEAMTFAANLLAASGASGFRMLEPKEEPKLQGDARWIMPGEEVGLVQVHPDMTPEMQLSLGRLLAGDDAKSCKGTFMSATLASQTIGSDRVVTTCDDGKAIVTSYYFTVPRRRGGAYLVATISTELAAPAMVPRAKEADANFRKAAFTIVER